MAGHRVEKIAADVRWIVSDVIRNKLNDPRIAPMTSVTRVEMSRDLRVAKIFISVLGTDGEERRTMAALSHARGHIQSYLAKNLGLRHCPEVRLECDESIKRGNETLGIIEQTVREQGTEADASDNDHDRANGTTE